jgi:hypothetical protein
MAWPSPIDAMAELESLLFRKTRGELFDMPAYRDVLFLYSLARDLPTASRWKSGHVDVLLPINEGADRTQPMSLDDLPVARARFGLIVPLDNQPTVPVDLDVTQPVMPDSLFGDVTDPGRRQGRRRHGPQPPARADSAAYSRPAAASAVLQRLVLLGEAQPRDALLEAAVVEGRQRDRGHADLARQPLAEVGFLQAADGAVVDALEVGAFAGQQAQPRAARPARKRSRLRW